MLNSTDYRELRNGKRYQTSTERIVSNDGSTEEIANRISRENVEGEVPELQTSTQDAVNEQNRGFITPLIRQLEEFTRLVQGMTTSRHPNSYPKTELGSTSGTAMPQSDIIFKPAIAEVAWSHTKIYSVFLKNFFHLYYKFILTLLDENNFREPL